MNTRRGFTHGLLVSLFLSLAACSGGGEVAGGGTGGTGSTVAVSRGPISDIGSIWVNGVEYDTTGATISIPGLPEFVDNDGTAGGSDLLVGMLVTVRGEINSDGVTGTATRVEYGRGLVGQVSGLTNGGTSGSTFSIYGQRVVIDNLTKFDPDPASTWLFESQWVEVSGFVLNGEVRATFIRQLTTQETVEIEGVVSTKTSNTITVGGATVVTVPAGFDLTPINPGSTYVEVHADAPAPTDTSLTATEISIQDTSLGGEEGDEAEVEGLITAVRGTTFVVAGQTVTFDATTEFSGGLDTDLLVGVKVEAEGSIDANGRLLAAEISFGDSIEIRDTVASSTANTLVFNLGSGITVELDPELTEGYGLVSHNPGDVVTIRGRASGGVVLATSIESADGFEVELQGPVEAFTQNNSLTILGVLIDASGLSFEANDQPVTSQTFFSQLSTGDLVQANGTRSGSTVTWDAAELE